MQAGRTRILRSISIPPSRTPVVALPLDNPHTPPSRPVMICKIHGSGPTEEVVLGLARNVRQNLGSDWTIGESGTCGPTGGHQPNRQPYLSLIKHKADCSRGTVVLAIVGPGVEVSKIAKTGLGGDRAGNMMEFARLALEFLVEQMEAQGQGNL
jgi:Competence-damaged protein